MESMFCDHANEVPLVCKCPSSCYCKTHSCKPTSELSNRGWIGVDLDGTLAYYDGWQGETHIGEAIPLMVERVKDWLADGRDVRIFTARVAQGEGDKARDVDAVREAIYAWSLINIGQALPVTNVKDWSMAELWDDRCVQVERNTGRRKKTDGWSNRR
jgi:hypothetical protein